MAVAGSKRAGIKTRRTSKHATYHQAQRLVTERNKARRAAKRAKRKALWREKGVKKNGKPVKKTKNQKTYDNIEPRTV